MKVMLLAAGKGERMRPLTDGVPKPLLRAGGRSLIEHQIGKLAAAGFRELVINHAWLGPQLEQALGDGSRLGVEILWSREGEPLETAGGIVKALPLLGGEPFVVVNADVWTDYPFRQLKQALQPGRRCHLVLVPNPPHHPGGDFTLGPGNALRRPSVGSVNRTYSGIAVYHPAMFAGMAPVKAPLLPLLQREIDAGRAGGEDFDGIWMDIGTPERLDQLDRMLGGAGSGPAQ